MKGANDEWLFTVKDTSAESAAAHVLEGGETEAEPVPTAGGMGDMSSLSDGLGTVRIRNSNSSFAGRNYCDI